jgi:hypothetical protein
LEKVSTMRLPTELFPLHEANEHIHATKNVAIKFHKLARFTDHHRTFHTADRYGI